jgi:hypothetical protein
VNDAYYLRGHRVMDCSQKLSFALVSAALALAGAAIPPIVAASQTSHEVNQVGNGDTTSQNRVDGAQGAASLSSQLPKADATVSQVYTAPDGNKIEIEGVCKITEDSVGCWNSDGSADDDLTKKIRETLEKQSQGSGPFGSSISIRYGKKNRMIVLKTTAKSADMSQFSLAHDASDMSRFNSPFGFGLNMTEGRPPQTPQTVRYDTRNLSEDPSAQAVTTRLRLTSRIKDEPTLDKKVGSTVKLGADTLRMVSITKDPNGQMLLGPRDAWVLKIESTTPTDHPAEFTVVPLNSSGETIVNADDNGNPVTEKQTRDEQLRVSTELQKNPTKSPFSLMKRRYQAVGNRNVNGVRDLVLYVNPSKVSKFKITGTTSKYIDFKDIRLDPK